MGSCNEVPPRIDFSEPILLARDTSYITYDVPGNPPRNILLEDVSGVNCQRCPRAAEIAHELKDRYPERVIVMTEHPEPGGGFGPLVAPFNDSQDSFNTKEATDIVANLIQNVGSLPNGAINRKDLLGNGSLALPKYETWKSHVENELSEKAEVDLKVELIPKDNRTVVANIKTTFLNALDHQVLLSVFLTESHIISKQFMPDRSMNYDYEHNFILRKGITHSQGLPLSPSVEKGRVIEKGFEIEIPERFKPENCSIVVLVHELDGENREVLQCQEKKVKP